MTKHYAEQQAKPDFAELEKRVLKFWEEDKTFEKSVHNRDGAAEFVFYDGPPFANGTPHYGHIMVSYVKDVVARFQTMSGKKVERRLGWDCHADRPLGRLFPRLQNHGSAVYGKRHSQF